MPTANNHSARQPTASLMRRAITPLTFLLGLQSGPGSDLLRHLARQELAVLGVAPKGAPFDDDLAAQHRQRRPGGKIAALPRAVISLVQFGGAHDVAPARVE